MTNIEIPPTAEHLSVRISLLGLVNMAGIIEYYSSDGRTRLWGPVPFTSANLQVFESGHHLYLLGATGESAALQRGRYAYVVVDINNYEMENATAQVLVEFFSWQGQQPTRIGNQINLYPTGTIAGRTDKRVLEIFKLI